MRKGKHKQKTLAEFAKVKPMEAAYLLAEAFFGNGKVYYEEVTFRRVDRTKEYHQAQRAFEKFRTS